MQLDRINTKQKYFLHKTFCINNNIKKPDLISDIEDLIDILSGDGWFREEDIRSQSDLLTYVEEISSAYASGDDKYIDFIFNELKCLLKKSEQNEYYELAKNINTIIFIYAKGIMCGKEQIKFQNETWNEKATHF